ncbi:MAG: ATP-binding protein [Gammaproteobacteria bacterium]|nr:ATP-binding protein [Gammaproteobacteria bacterium]
METEPLHRRFAEAPLTEALADSPAVLIHGPRQCGKTTLAQLVGESRGYAYISFDEDVARTAAIADPAGFVAGLGERVILDEVQRVPALFTALKREIDINRIPGRFLLTGSSQVLLIPALSDSLAGRMEILRLYPLSQGEIHGVLPDFLDNLFAGRFPTATTNRLAEDLPFRIAAGGYPEALTRATARRRSNWYRNYAETQLERDARDLARISAPDALPRLLGAAASQTARLYNLSDLASPFQLSRTTIGAYVELLERLFLIDRLPAWHSNRLNRIIKSAKLHVGDTGLASALTGCNPDTLAQDPRLFGQFLETFVFQELKRQSVLHEQPLFFYHYRDKDKVEIDVVIERGGLTVAGIEVKASATVNPSDFKGLRKLKRTAGNRFAAGVVLYDGEITAGFGDGMFAVPLRVLFEGLGANQAYPT